MLPTFLINNKNLSRILWAYLLCFFYKGVDAFSMTLKIKDTISLQAFVFDMVYLSFYKVVNIMWDENYNLMSKYA